MNSIRGCVIALAAALGLGAGRPAAVPAPVAYEVSPEIRDGQLQALDVIMRLTAGPDGRVKLQLPQATVGVTELWSYLRDIKVEGARAVTAPKPSERLIEAGPGAAITIRYRVVSAFDHEPLVSELETYKPLIRPTRFWIYGDALFAYSTNAETATFRWTGAPPGFGFASDLERAGGKPMSNDDLIESVSVGGPDLQVHRRDLGGAPVRVATIGKFGFADAALVDMAMKVIVGERAFWGGKEGPFLVVAAPLRAEAGHISIRGEGRGDAFAIQGGADTPLDMFKFTLAHEYFHTWNPGRLGSIHEGAAERADYWFSEGFTDFYARKLALRSGVFSLEEFVTDWNQMLGSYAASPVRAAPNSRVAPDFWKNQDAEKLPYQRGSILAATWDRELRARSGGKVGIDEVMLSMRDRAAKLGRKSPKAPQLFEAAIHSFGLDVRPDVDRVIGKGAATLLPKDAFGGCLTVTSRQAPHFELGYSLETEDGTRVLAKVDPAGPAYAAGLRDGMIYVRRVSGYPGDIAQNWKLRVRENGEEREVSYLPAGKGTETLQRLELPKDLTPAAKAACAKAVATAR